MPRYIDADALRKQISETYEYEFPTASGGFDEFATKIIPNIINNAITADVVPVVRGEWEYEHGTRLAAADLIESMQAQLADRGTRPATNADHLRRMSDEELAKFQASRFNFTWKYMPESRWLDWLRQPAEEAHDGQA